MKKFKNKIAVTGSKSLLQAFAQELDNLGYRRGKSYGMHWDTIVTNWGDVSDTYCDCYAFHSRLDRSDIKLSLPQHWHKAIELAIEEEETKPKFTEGQWLHDESPHSRALLRFNGINSYNNIITKEYYQVSQSILISEGASDQFIHSSNVTVATQEQIEDMLTVVAKAKGFVEGVKLATTGINEQFNRADWFQPIQGYYSYHQDIDILDSGDGHIYEAGKWAEIAKKELIIHGYKVNKISPTEVKVGCKEFTRKSLEELYAFFAAYNGHYVYKDVKWYSEDVKEVLTVFDD